MPTAKVRSAYPSSTYTDVAANMIGRSNSQRAARQVFGAMQIRLLNLHIIMTIIDEVSLLVCAEAYKWTLTDMRPS